MPKVPYQPFPNVSPIAPGERISVQTPPAAFGANIGAALEHLGTTGEQVGGELFQRAIAMKELDNETEARSKASAYVEQQGIMQADYDSKVGKEAVDGLVPHLNASRALREQLRGDMSNPASARMFDSMTFGFMGRIVRESASRAGTAHKQVTIDGFNAEADIARRSVESDPDNPNVFNEGKARAVDAIKNAAMIKHGVGEDDTIVVDAGVKAEQMILGSKIKGIARDRPLEAIKLMEENKKALGDQYDVLKPEVETKGNAVASSNIVDGVIARHTDKATGKIDASVADMQAEAEAEAKEKFPSFSLLPTSVKRGIDFQIRNAEFSANIDNKQATLDLKTIIAKHPEIKDVQDLLAIPGVDQQVRKMRGYNQETLQTLIDHTRSTIWHQEWEVNAAKLKGWSSSDVMRFLNEDLEGWNLKPDVRIELQNKQLELSKNPSGDPRVDAGMHVLTTAFGGQLKAMGVNHADYKNPNSLYNHFRGALQEQLAEWAQDHPGKKPSYDDITTDIWQKVKSQHMVNGWFGRQVQDYAFKQYTKPSMDEIPEEYVSKKSAEVMQKFGVTPSRQQLYRAYLRDQWQELLKNQAKTESKTLMPHGQ